MSKLVNRKAGVFENLGAAPKCEICKLFLSSAGSVATRIAVTYGPEGVAADEGNQLSALNRRVWICTDCATAIAEAQL